MNNSSKSKEVGFYDLVAEIGAVWASNASLRIPQHLTSAARPNAQHEVGSGQHALVGLLAAWARQQ